jgi:NADH:ubiquinone oxidoreductase subunit 5 (subunit L)/multisubunit Na+/H+ antiporter MnhA subunit
LYHSYLRFEINKRIFIADNFYRKTWLKNYVKYVAFFNKKFFIDDFYNFLALNVYKWSYILFRTVDRGLLELLGPRGLVRVMYKLSKKISRTLQSGHVYQYTFIILLNLFFICFLAFFLFV